MNIIKNIRKIEDIFHTVGLVLLFALMVLGTADVAARYFFNSPIKGTVETSRMMLMGIVVFGWAYTQANKAHVSVDFLVNHFPKHAQAITDFITSILALCLFVLICWQSIAVGIVNMQDMRLVQIIHIPVGIMDFIVSFGAALICIELIIQIVELYRAMARK